MPEPTNDTRAAQTASSNTSIRNLGVLIASRREALKSGATFAAGALAAEILPDAVSVQDAGAAELNKLLGERRILIRGGVVLTLDGQLGDSRRPTFSLRTVRSVRCGPISRHPTTRLRWSTPRIPS